MWCIFMLDEFVGAMTWGDSSLQEEEGTDEDIEDDER